MEKLDGKSMDIVKANIEALKQLFPEVVTEGKIDFEKLKLILGEEIETRNEKYEFTWHGKTRAMKLAQTPSTGTLRPDKASSKNWDTTENLYIEGDNLEVLKLLQKSYFGKIKMIYIDPPYNTGKDFVYKDDFRDNIKNYKEITQQTTKANTETSGRYHTDWLNMMYPRLKLARNLLREDGIIFISIDDIESSNLKKICDEVFGEENFIAQLIWNTEGHTDNQFDIKINHEYILMYVKDLNFKSKAIGYVVDPNTRAESNVWKGFAENSITKNGPANPPSEVLLPKGFPCAVDEMVLEPSDVPNEYYSDIEKVGYITREITRRYDVSYPIRKDPMIVKNGKLQTDCRVYSGWANVNKLKQFIENGFKPIEEDDGKMSFYLSKNGVIYYIKEREKVRHILSVLRNMGTTEQNRSRLEQTGIYFNYPKPLELIQYLLKIGSENDSIILDFFSGSATTAHAVMQLNAEDGGNRKFIMVQFPEKTDEKSEAYKAGYKNICEIGKERIRRAGEKIVQETGKTDLDIGFKVFKLDSSNVKAWDPDFDNLEQTLFDLQDNIKEDRTKEDLLYEILLKIGLPLTTPIEEIDYNGKTIYNVAYGSVLVCLEDDIDLDIVQEMLKYQSEHMPPKVIFKESGFMSDAVKTNALQTLKKHGITDVRSV
ncbi:site-specific DNA-methyltransferase [Geobacillus subterraneus]|uniref:site-specific DNA-methyltransferase n=1 Tax=Geobacillus subterraneus TaxID=129338 RepID=UPI001442BD73|nr:site-specific DNA-methyltransferase [Geobacillus subterraneus]QIZ67481.1 site-specific DNA-methyltransferase [Geobacillus subterraneus]WPZ19664.1 site-specific DNA-methyltransferase [Geobacillus subterraneus]